GEATDETKNANSSEAVIDVQPAPVTTREPAPVAKVSAPPPCPECGIIERITPLQQSGTGTGLGAVVGGVGGALLGSQIGGGSGKKLATIAGAAGGALAGHEAEKQIRNTASYEIVVRHADGRTSLVNLATPGPFTVGEPVRLVNGQLMPR
ncbi:MAG: glycine zipper 2TM domain-containing protein, partial [Gammaproteobacteria bacterium]|nr:glycine zipper 2TM domain-containing protein [Gammaproteobacteria bacterium]